MGKTCLVYFSPERLSHNSVMYEESITPDHWPGGGGFSVTQLSLNALYDMHLKCLNWWTNSNVDLPLCRYSGVYLKFYQCDTLDYAVKIQTQLPSSSNKLTYPSTQSSMMLMSKGKLIIPSKQNEKRRKPYKKVFISPPPQLQNKWYFQVDMYKTPLLTIHTSAVSLDNYFIKPDKKNHNITFYSLNTELIQNRQIGINTNTSWHYKKIGNVLYYFYFYDGPQIPNKLDDIQLQHLIALANPRDYNPGMSFAVAKLQEQIDLNKYKENYSKYWGNPFHEEHQQQLEHWFISTVSPETLKASFTNENSKWSDIQNGTVARVLTQLEQPIYIPYQYNPNKDTGQDTMVYLLSNQQGDGWDPPTKPELILTGFPLWLIFWGFVDFQIKLGIVQSIYTKYIVVCKTKFTQRPQAFPIVPINESFTKGKSPYENSALVADYNKWYPQVQYQTMEINKIVSCGPGTPYLPNQKSENIQMYYKFVWRWGGSPPKTVNIDNPSHQIVYPIPNSEHETTSLQNPAQTPESLLYSFDYRHGNITTTAIDRISKDWSTTNFFASITEPERRNQLQTAFQELQTSEEKEHKTQEEIFQQLQQLRHQQQYLRQRIIYLMQSQTE